MLRYFSIQLPFCSCETEMASGWELLLLWWFRSVHENGLGKWKWGIWYEVLFCLKFWNSFCSDITIHKKETIQKRCHVRLFLLKRATWELISFTSKQVKLSCELQAISYQACSFTAVLYMYSVNSLSCWFKASLAMSRYLSSANIIAFVSDR